MSKRIVIVSVVLIALFGLSMTALAEALIMNLRGGDSVEINCDGAKLNLTRTGRNKVKADCKTIASNPTTTPAPPTSVPSTTTPAPPTSVPPTRTPEPQPTTNPSSISLCPDHDPTKAHPLFDAARNCHYDHEHHDDPHEVDDLFGPVGALYGGQEISYPWQTSSHHGLENEVKHEGYKWLVRKNMDCYSKFEDGCLTDFRVQVHFIAAAMDATVRYHSFWMEARGCRENNPSVCGLIRTGGWVDYGHLEVDSQYVPLEGDPSSRDSGHRRIHYNQTGNNHYATWYGQSALAIVAIQTGRMWSLIDPNNPSAENLFCPDYRCSYNGSNLQAHDIGLKIPSQLDTDGDNLVTFSGYTNRYGAIVQGCTAIGLDCVPLEIINMPVGRYAYRDSNSGMGDGRTYDTSPSGEWWITFPN